MSANTSFSGHETFPLRFPWLAKSVEAVSEDPEVFRDETAIATFGVGRNMVRSIRHWGLATGVLAPHPEERGAVVVTQLGRELFGAEGADPYCEDPGTLWLLHWLLCRDVERATLWHFVFGHWQSGALDLRALQAALEPWLARFDATLPSKSTLKRDLLCLAGTYTVPAGSRRALEDVVACPLSTLNLMMDDGGALYLRQGRQRGLPPEIFAYAVMDYWALRHSEVETLDVREILEAPGAPGRIFLLGEDQAFELVERVGRLSAPPFTFDSTAGVQQLYRTGRSTPSDMIAAYYATGLVA
jgi:hypothetical protein